MLNKNLDNYDRERWVRDVPVILLSWKEDLLQRVRELGAGADGYLRKEAAASTVLSRIREVLRPRARVESRLDAGGEVRGRLDGLTTRLLLELARRHQPSSRIIVRDSVYLYELEMRDGRPRCITRTAADGSFERGSRVLDALIGVTAGRFVVTPSSSPAREDFGGSLDDLLKPRVRRARALARVFEGRELDEIDSVLIDVETVGAYLDATPEPARGLFSKLLGGASPREILAEAPSQRYFLEQVLADIARRGAVIEVTRGGEPVDFDQSAHPAEVVTDELEPSPGPLFTLDLSQAPPDVGEAVARWEKPEFELREASIPLPLSRLVTPVPVMVSPDSEPRFSDEPRTAPGMGPVLVPVATPNAAPSAPAPVTEPAVAEAEVPAPDPGVDEAGESSMMSAEPALVTARSEDVPAEAPREVDETDGSDDALPLALVSQRDPETPSTLRTEPATVEPAVPSEKDAKLQRGGKRPGYATLPSAKPIEFPRKRAEGAPSSRPAPASTPSARPAAGPSPDKSIGLGKTVLIAAGAAAAAFAGITLLRTVVFTSPSETRESAAPVESAAPALAKPAPAQAVKLAVEELGIEAGTAVSNDKGLVEVAIAENFPIYVDGTFIGRGPKRRVPVAAGAHEVVLKAPTGDLSVQVDVKVGRRSRVTLPAANP